MLKLADEFVAHSGESHAALSKKIYNDNTFFGRMKAGKNFTARSYDRCIDWFHKNWLSNIAWPCDVPRPEEPANGIALSKQSDEAA